MENLDETLADYNNDMARALAGAMTGKSNDDLDDVDVEKAKEVSSDIPDLGQYIELHNALDANNTQSAKDLALKHQNPMTQNDVTISSMEESNLVDRDILSKKGFNYFGVFEDEKLRGKVTRFLDEEEVEYMDDGSGHLQMKFKDRESVYKIESALAKMGSRNNPHFMRDHIELDEVKPRPVPKKYRKTKTEKKDEKCVACNGSGHYDTDGSPPCSACNGTGKKQVDERAPDEPKHGTEVDDVEDEVSLPSFQEWRVMNPELKNHGKAKRAYKSWLGTQVSESQLEEFHNPFSDRRYGHTPDKRFANITDIDQLQNMADKLSREGAPEAARRAIHARIAELQGENWVEESIEDAKYNKAATLEPVKESLDMDNKKLDEHVLGMTRLQTLAGIPVTQIDEAEEEKPESVEDFIKGGIDDMEAKSKKEKGLDESLFDEAEDDLGVPGELGADPIEVPMEVEPEMDMVDEPVMDVDPELGPPADGMGMEVDDFEEPMDAGEPMDEPMDAPVDDFGMDAAMDDIGSVEAPALPAMDMAPMETDVRTDIETALSDMLTKAPDLKISDYKDVVHRAEEVISQIRAMGSQYLKEGAKLSKKDAAKTIRETANTGFKKALFDANSK